MKRDALMLGLCEETVKLFHCLRAASEAVQGEGTLSGGRRGVMVSLDRQGPLTVPQLARMRPVSRQHIQLLVNALLEDGLVEYRPNPQHERSKLVALTEKGRQQLVRILAREQRFIESLKVETSMTDLDTAARVLSRISKAIEERL